MRFLNSVKSLYAAVAILFLMVGLGVYVDTRNDSMHSQQLELNVRLERMVRLNQELTNMLVIAVLKHNALGTASYETVNSDLQQTMGVVAELTRTQVFAQDILSLSDTQSQLRAVEAKALALINDERWDEASAMLLDDEYVLLKKTYEVDSEAAVGTVMGELKAQAERFGRIRDVSLGLRIGALFLLLWVGVMFSRRSRADLAEQIRLRDEVTAAYDGMEARVRERTDDLEKTTRRLAEENEEREKSDRRTRLILNSAGEGIFGIDAQGRGIFFNDTAVRLLGYSAEEMTGQELHSLIHHQREDGTPLPAEERPMHVACSTGRPGQSSGAVFWRKDGSHFLSEYSVTPMVDEHGQADGAVVVFRDVTAQRRDQAELRARMDELERFNRLTMGRELRMIELKQEINALLLAAGAEKKYQGAAAEDSAAVPAEKGGAA